jgi:hypothetical protein
MAGLTETGRNMHLSSFSKRLRFLGSMLQMAAIKHTDHPMHLCERVEANCSSGLPQESLAHFLGTQLPTVKLLPVRGRGTGSLADVIVLSAIAAASRPKRILEFGTCDGFSTWHLWANSDAHITTIDLPAGMKVSGSTDPSLQGVEERPCLPNDPERIALLELDSRAFQPSGTFDLCFIDAGHSYECVRNDTAKAMSVMQRGSIIAWHDAGWKRDGYGVNCYLRELLREHHPITLIEASAYDFCQVAVMRWDG